MTIDEMERIADENGTTVKDLFEQWCPFVFGFESIENCEAESYETCKKCWLEAEHKEELEC